MSDNDAPPVDPLFATSLEKAGLGRFAEPLAAAGWDLAALASATDKILAEIGLTPSEMVVLREVLSGGEAAGWRTTGDPESATREVPFVNCLGMLFVPVPRFKALFSICLVRILDYEIFCDKTECAMPGVDYAQEADHPVVNVSWKEACEFCRWLNDVDRVRSAIPENFSYRLPTDAEWSAAVGLPSEVSAMPKALDGGVPGYPWGPHFPPPVGAGNYSPVLNVDDFRETSPVASFPPNAFGIYDLGGNVWEMCLDRYDADENSRVARGASCFNDGEEYLRSSARNKIKRDTGRNNVGFRVVLGPDLRQDPMMRVRQDPWG